MKNNPTGKFNFPNVGQDISNLTGLGAEFGFKRVAPLAQNFETYASFKPWAEESLRSLRQGTMPPPESDPPAPAADVCMFAAWVGADAPNN